MTIETAATIALTLNGEPQEMPAGASVRDLILRFGLNPLKVAVERNRMLVPRSTFADVRLEAGDSLEIVSFVGGG